MLQKQQSSKTSQLSQIATSFLCTAILFIFVACGAKDQAAPVIANLVSGTSGSDSDMIKDQRVNCFGVGEGCPSSIAKIVSIIPGGDKHCTGFLINKQTLLTAASCLPEELRKEENAPCANRLFILFPEAKGSPEQRVECGSVAYASPLENSNPAFIKQNWAQITLATPVNRDVLSVSTEGMLRAKDNKDKKYTSWRVSSENGAGNNSIIKKYECDVLEETYGNPLAKGRFFPNPTIGKCTYYNEFGVRIEEASLYRGNLGAPIISSNGNVVGIVGDDLMSAEEYEKLKTANFIHFKNQTQNYEDLKIMKFSTNLACLSQFAGLPLPAECTDLYTEADFNAKRANLLKSETADGMATAEEYIRVNNRLDNGKKLQWDIKFRPIQDQRREVTYTPKCYNAPDAWLPTEDSLYYKVLTFKLFLKQEADMKVSFNNLGILIRLNGFLQPEARYEVRKDEAQNNKSTVEFTLTVKPTKIKDKKTSEIIVKESALSMSIPVCE